MRVLGIILASSAFLFGIRLLFLAFRIAVSGQILVRDKVRTHWQPAPSSQDAWKAAFREAIMGLLFVILGVALLT